MVVLLGVVLYLAGPVVLSPNVLLHSVTTTPATSASLHHSNFYPPPTLHRGPPPFNAPYYPLHATHNHNADSHSIGPPNHHQKGLPVLDYVQWGLATLGLMAFGALRQTSLWPHFADKLKQNTWGPTSICATTLSTHAHCVGQEVALAFVTGRRVVSGEPKPLLAIGNGLCGGAHVRFASPSNGHSDPNSDPTHNVNQD